MLLQTWTINDCWEIFARMISIQFQNFQNETIFTISVTNVWILLSLKFQVWIRLKSRTTYKEYGAEGPVATCANNTTVSEGGQAQKTRIAIGKSREKSRGRGQVRGRRWEESRESSVSFENDFALIFIESWIYQTSRYGAFGPVFYVGCARLESYSDLKL